MGRRSRAAADRLHSVAIHVLRYAREADKTTGIRPAQLSALSVLVFAGPRLLGELAAAEGVKPSTMSVIVAALEADGLIRRQADKADARASILHPTVKGIKLLERARAARLERIEALLESAGSANIELLDRALRAVFPP